MPLKVEILISAYNHKQKVLSCLEDCMHQIDALAAEEKYDFTVRFMDDCSTDGTIEAVTETFPKVIARRSQARMYRNGSLRTLWFDASKDSADFYIWLDARISLKENALSTILETSSFLSHKSIIAGSVSDPEGLVVRGGRTRKGKICEPDHVIPIPTQTFDGTLVMVPLAAYKTLGMTSSSRKEFLGDWEYGIKALRAEVPRVIAPGILATCDELSDVKIPKGARFIYDIKSSGIFFAIRNFFHLTFRAAINNSQ